MATMNDKSKSIELSEAEIDKLIIAQANDDAAWEDPVFVHREETTLSLSPDLAARAAFLAQLHKESNVEEWLRIIIQERIDFEEAAFADLKRAMAET
jgi:hypothetical protein